MYISGEKFLWTNFDNPENNIKEDGFRLKEKIFELAYWRKHPDLHSYIVNEFADGVDECQRIDLSKEDLMQLLVMISNNDLPSSGGGPFFGESGDAGDQETVKQLQGALKWLEIKEKGVARSLFYRASW